MWLFSPLVIQSSLQVDRLKAALNVKGFVWFKLVFNPIYVLSNYHPPSVLHTDMIGIETIQTDNILIIQLQAN